MASRDSADLFVKTARHSPTVTGACWPPQPLPPSKVHFPPTIRGQIRGQIRGGEAVGAQSTSPAVTMKLSLHVALPAILSLAAVLVSECRAGFALVGRKCGLVPRGTACRLKVTYIVAPFVSLKGYNCR